MALESEAHYIYFAEADEEAVARALRWRRVALLVAAVVLAGAMLASTFIAPEEKALSFAEALAISACIGVVAVVVGYVVLPRKVRGRRIWVGGDFIAAENSPATYTSLAKYDDIVRVFLRVSQGRIVGATVAAKTGLLYIGWIENPASVIRVILDRAPERVKWYRSWLSFVRLRRDKVREMIERVDAPDILALLPPGKDHSCADEVFSRDRPKVPLPGKRGLFGPQMGWPVEIATPVLASPASRHVNFMLIQMFQNGTTTSVLKQSQPLPDLTLGSDTATAPPLDEVLAVLKRRCRLDPNHRRGPREGMFELTIEDTPCKLECRFDDDVESCCQMCMTVAGAE